MASRGLGVMPAEGAAGLSPFAAGAKAAPPISKVSTACASLAAAVSYRHGCPHDAKP